MGQIPRIIWTYWDSGFHDAPDVVKFSLHSWITLNPGWTVRALDDSTVEQWVNPEERLAHYKNLPIQKQANLLRKQLLATYGGVWVDATTACLRPLDEWLDLHPADGFAMWRNTDEDRVICNWFIAAEQGNRFLTEWLNSYVDFFSRPRLHKPLGKDRDRLDWYLSLQPTAAERSRFWNSWFARKIVKVYPYYISHYLAGHLLLNDKRFEPALRSGAIMPQPSRLTLNDDWTRGLLCRFETKDIPMLKLSHRAPHAHIVAEYLPVIKDIVKKNGNN